MSLLRKTLVLSVLVLSPVANAGFMLDTAIISYEGLGHFAFEYTGNNLFYEEGFDENGNETFEADFGSSWDFIDFNLTNVGMDIQDLTINSLVITYGGILPGVVTHFSAYGKIDGLNYFFDAQEGGCWDINCEFVSHTETLFATYKEVSKLPETNTPEPLITNDVPEPSIITLFATGLLGLGFARRSKA